MSIISGYMVPHPPIAVHEIGRGEEKKIQDTLDAYDAVAKDIARLRPETIIISSPHSIMYSDYFHISPGKHASGDFGQFGAPQVSFDADYDDELVEEICRLCDERNISAGTEGERDPLLDHGTMVPLYFITKRYTDFRLVRLGLSGLTLEEHWRLGKAIADAVANTDRRAVYVASGDLSHCQKEDGPYGYKPVGPEYDNRLIDAMSRGSFSELKEFDEKFLSDAEECGHRSFTIMGGALDGQQITPQVLSHEATFGVGYGVGIFHTALTDEPVHDPYVQLARDTVNTYISRHEVIEIPDGLPQEMLVRRAGTFVSIHEKGRLRGCIGTIGPTCRNVAEEIIQNAISASTRDPRFYPIEQEELPDLEISVDVLSEPEKIDSPDMLDVHRYGVIVSCGGRRGLLLPDLDGVDTVEQQISIAAQKGGISLDEPFQLERFEVIRHEDM